MSGSGARRKSVRHTVRQHKGSANAWERTENMLTAERAGSFETCGFKQSFWSLLGLWPKVTRARGHGISPRARKREAPPPTFPCGFHVETVWKTFPSPTAVETFPVFPPCPVDKKWRKIRDLRPFPQKFSLLLLLRNKRLVYVVLLKKIPVFFQKGSTGKDPALC